MQQAGLATAQNEEPTCTLAFFCKRALRLAGYYVAPANTISIEQQFAFRTLNLLIFAKTQSQGGGCWARCTNDGRRCRCGFSWPGRARQLPRKDWQHIPPTAHAQGWRHGAWHVATWLATAVAMAVRFKGVARTFWWTYTLLER